MNLSSVHGFLPSLVFLQPTETDRKPCNITAKDRSQTKYVVFQIQVTFSKVSKEQLILCIDLSATTAFPDHVLASKCLFYSY